MNEEALNRLFILAKNDGYKKSIEEFKVLMSSNEEAINTMYGLAQGDGYLKDINEFKTLVGFNGSVDVKKKDETLPQSGQPSEVVGQPSTGTPAMESDLTLQSQTSTELVSPLDGSTLALEEEKRRKQILESPMYSEEYKAQFATTPTPTTETQITTRPTTLPEFVEKQQRKTEVENKFKSLVDSEDIVNKALKVETIDPEVFGDGSFDISTGRWLSFNENTLTQEEENELIKKGFIKNPQKNNGEYLKPISGEVLYFLPDKINTIKRIALANERGDEKYLLKSDGIKPGSIQEEVETDLNMQQKYDIAKDVLKTAGVETNSTNLDKFVDRYKDLLSQSLGVEGELTDDQMYELSLKSFDQDPSGEELTKILQNKMRTQKGSNFNYLLAQAIKEQSTEPLSRIEFADYKENKLTDTQYKFIEEVINARNYLANTRQDEKTNSFRRKVEDDFIVKNAGSINDAKSDMTSYLSDFSELSLSPKDKLIVELKVQLKNAEDRNDTKAIEVLKKELYSVDKNYNNELFDSRTGMYISNTAKDIPQRVIDENKRVEEYIAEYSKDDIGSLMKRRDDILMKMFQAAEELKINSDNKLLASQPNSIEYTQKLKNIAKYGNPTEQLDKNSGNYYLKLKSSPDLYNLFAIINSDGVFNDEELKKARDLQERYRAINSAIARNEDPGSEYMLSQEGFWNSFGTGFTQGVRDMFGYKVDDPLSDSQKADIVIEEISRDYELTDSQKAKLENTFTEKFGATVGGMLPVMGEIVVDALIVKKGSSLIGAEKFIEKISKGNKGLEKALKYGLSLTESAATFELAGQGAAAGVGEKLGEDAVDAIFKSITSKNPILKAIIGTVGGTIGEGVAEYSGEFVDRLVSGQNYQDAIVDTFGRTPEDAKEKAALTFIAAALMSAPMATLNALSSEYKDSDGKYEGDSPFINAAIELEQNKDNDVFNALINNKPTPEKELVEEQEVVSETKLSPEEKSSRISEIESMLSYDDASFAEKGQRVLMDEARTELQTELQTLKTEQDAIQEQTTSEVPIQPEARVGEEMAQGEPQAEPEVTTEEGKEEIVSEIDTVITTDNKVVPAGKRLFNEPNPETAEISKSYKEKEGISTTEGSKIEQLDTDRSMQIADAYEAMQDAPNDPMVQEAYSKLAEETKKQYDAIKAAGYEVEVWEGEGEPYKNAQEMIDDVRNNKHMYIFSTEKGFGDTPITEQQRQQNAMLQDSGAVDKNGNKLLYNDMFRFVHDFFGHSERGNGFGAIGEENAWDVHARMYSPLARRAMTTETRGQNSWVNFGPQMRNKNGQIIKKGEPGYLTARERAFAPQKMGLLPLEFSNIIESKVEVETKPEITEGAKKLLDALKPKVDKPNVRKQVENAEKAIAKISPETKIIVHETSQDYVSSGKARKQNEGGEYDIENNTIHINLEAANDRTVAHEVFHAILLNKGMSNKQAQAITTRMLDAVKKSASPELTKRLDDFSSKYDEPLQSEESIAELFGILASEYETLPRPTQNLIKRWLDMLAKLFGLKPFTDNEIVDMMNVVSTKIEEGVEIKEKEIKPIRKVDIEKEFEGGIPVDELTDADLDQNQISQWKGGKEVESPTKALRKQKVGAFDVEYTEQKKLDELISKGLVKEPNSLSEFTDMNTAITSPDDMLAGNISIDGKQIFEGGGGVFFVTKYGDVWASGNKGTANTLKNAINKSVKNNNGKGLLVLAKGSDRKLISSASGVNSSISVLNSMLDKGLVSLSDFKKAFTTSIKKAGGKINMTGSSKDLSKKVNEYFSDPRTTTFEKRGFIIQDVIGNIAQSSSVKNNQSEIISFLGGDPKLGVAKGNTPKGQSLVDMVAKIAAEDLTKGLSTGDVYAVIETNGEVEVVEDSHPSYPFHVRSKDGSKPVLHLPKNRENGREILKTASGKPYKVGNVSVMSGKFNDLKPSSKTEPSRSDVEPRTRKQKPLDGRPSIESIRKKAKELGVSEEDVYIALRDLGYSDPEISGESKARKDKAINDAKDKYDLSVNKRGNKHKDGVESAINDLKKSDWYNESNDTQREEAVRELKKFFGEKTRKAPSVDKVLAKKKDKATVDEAAALKDQIKLEARAARESRLDQNKKREKLATSINEILMNYDKNATIRNKKFKAINNRINKTNLDNEVSVEKLLNYIENTFRDAEYGLKLSIAKRNSTSIRKEIKRKRKDPVLLATAKNFLLIDPSLVSDIDAYLEMSNKIANGLKPTSITDTKTDVSSGFNVSDVDAYVENELEIQDKILAEALDKQIDQITELEIKAKQEMEKRNIQKVFDYYSLLAKQMLKNNEDPFTGEDIDIDAETKTLISKLINIDPLSITKDDAIKAIEAINNFLVNQSTSNVQSIVAKFEAVEDARKELDRGTKSRDLKLYFSKGAGRVISSYFTGLPLIFEKIFGKTPGLRIMRAMGLTDIIQGKSKAIKTLQGILNSYNNVFSKTEPNGQKFNTSYNIAERGLIAFMKRHIPGSEQVDFKTRKKLIKQSIERLKLDGDKDQVKKAEIYEEVYNKTLKGVNNIKELESKADGTNLKAVDWWTNEWSKHYDQLSVVNREVYNEILDKDNNYTPDVFSSMGDVKVDLDRSSFFNSSNYVNKKKTGSLIQSTRPSNLPEGRYVNLDFDFNNANALLGALQDINTASSVMKLDGFLKSDEFKKLIKSNDDRKLLVDRINTYINDMKGANMYSYDELKNVSKAINFVSSVGVSKALGGGAQVLKQTMPVALNTMINAGGINLLATLNKDYTAWLDNVGSGVSIRGIESTAEIDRLNSLIEKAADSKFEEATKLIKKANDLWLNIFLKHPDVWIAKSSFQAYYLQSLKRQGLEYKNIDWSTHEANQEAVDYAQNQVDRQQNFSDVALQGKLFTDKNQVLQLVRKMVFPFASFRMNQKSRMYSDFINLWRGDSSRQDRIDSVRSLGGLAVEQAAFLAIGALIKSIIVSLAYSFIGVDEDEEDREKRIDGYIKGAKTNAILDFASPIPHTDFLITGGYNKLVDVLSDEKIPEEERGYLYDEEGRPREVLNDLGTMGIAAKEIDALLEMSRMAYDGEYTTEFFGRKKDKKIWDKENMIIPAVFQALYVTGALPKDFSDFAKYTTKAMKNRRTK